MAIKLPGLAEQLAPSMPGLQELFANLGNPNWKQQAALRDAINSGRINATDLAKLSDEDVERLHGKGTAALKPRNIQPSMRDMVDKFGAQEVARRMGLPDGDPLKEEILTGFKTANERKASDQQVKTGDQQIKLNEIKLTDEDRRTQNILLNRTVTERLQKQGRGQNIYEDYKAGLINPEEKTQLMSDDDFRQRYDRDFRDYWSKIDENYRQKALDQKYDPKNLSREYNLQQANKIADRARDGNVVADVQTIVAVLETPQLQEMWSGKPRPTNPDSAKVWDAVKAVETSRGLETTQTKRDALDRLRVATAEIVRNINLGDEKGLDKQQIQSEVDRYNEFARTYLSGYLPANEIPQVAYDKEGPRSKRGPFLPDSRTLYYTQGAKYGHVMAPEADPLASWQGKTKEEIDARLKNVAPADRQTTLQALIKRGWYK